MAYSSSKQPLSKKWQAYVVAHSIMTSNAQKVHFAYGGIFDQIYAK